MLRPRPALTLITLALVFCSSSCFVFCTPRPFVQSVSPSSVVAGGSQFVLTVIGSDFRFDSIVRWNGGFRPTTFVSFHELAALISAGDIAAPGLAEVRVFTPPGDSHVAGFTSPGIISIGGSCGGGNSNVVFVSVIAAVP